MIDCSLLIACLATGHSKGTEREKLTSIAPRLYAAGNHTPFNTENKHAALRTAYLKLDGANAKGQMKEPLKRKMVHEQHLALVNNRQKLHNQFLHHGYRKA